MANVGFLGLGIMGGPMAQHLVAAGHNVTVWSHNPEKASRFADAYGAVAVATPAEVARRSEYIFLCVGDTAMSREVILGASGLADGAAAGTLIVDCSTISPLVSKEIAHALRELQIRFLDAPCTGSKSGAEAGTLSFMIGGEREAFEEARPLFEAMGKAFYYCGSSGMGLHAKVTQNLILGNLLQAFNEGLVLSTKAGVDPQIMLEILNNSGARSNLVAAKAPFVFSGDFEPTFSVRWMEKDLGLGMELSAALGVPLPVTAVSQQMLRAAIAQGYGDEDICGSIRVLEEIAGCQVRHKTASLSA
jgi:3-hydroxyisobutyrate dehydrogenase-like beta-hydroxyacid dehydrogenase